MEPSLSLACEAVRLLQLHGVSPLLSSPLTQDCLRLPAAAPASARSTRASPPPLCAFYSSFSPDVSSPPFEDDAAPPSRRAGPGAQPLPCGLLSSAPATPLDVPACIRRPDIGASASPFCSRRPRATHPPSPSSPSSSRPSSSSDFSSCPSSSSQACACCEASVESSSLCAAAVFKETDARRASKRRARDSSASFSSGAAATCAYPPSGCRFFFAAHAPSSARVVCCVWARRRADADASRSREGGNEREEKQRERCCCREREAASCEAILTSAVLQAAAPQGEDDDPSRGEAEEDAGEGERTAEDSLRLDGIRAASASCAFTRGSGRDLAGSWEEACGRAPCCATRMEEQRWSVPIARRGEEEVCSVLWLPLLQDSAPHLLVGFNSGSVCIYSASGSLCLAFGWMDTPPLRAVAFLDPLESAAISTSGAFSASPFVWTRAPGASPSFTTPAISAATPLFSSRGADAEDAREMSANEMNGESPGSLQETPPACVGFLFAAPVSSASPPNVESLVGIASLAALRRALFAPESVSAGGGGGAGRDDRGKRLLEPADASEGPRVRRGGEEERADASRAVERVLLKLNRGTTHAIALVPRSCASGAAALSMHLDSDDAIIFAPELLTDLADASSLAACAPSASQFLFGDRAASSSCMMSPAAPSLSLRQTRRGAAAARERLAAAAADSAPSSSPLATAATGGVPAAPLAASPASSVASALLEVGVLAAGRDAVLTLHVYPAAALSAEAARVGARVTRRGETRTLALRTLRPTRLLSAAASYVSHGLSSLLGSPAHAAEETPAPASPPVPGSRTENGKPRAEGADGVDSVGAVNLPSLAGQVLDERRRTGLSLAVCPWNAKLAAITDNCGRVSLVHTSSLEILHMWKGYREAQVAWLRRGRASSPARPSQAPEGGLVFYAPRRNSVELWSTPSLAFTPHTPRRVGLLFADPPGAAAPLRLVANGGRVLLVDAEGRVAALGWPSPPEALGATLAGLFEVSR